MSNEKYWQERSDRLKQESIALDNEIKELKAENRALVYKVGRLQEELKRCKEKKN